MGVEILAILLMLVSALGVGSHGITRRWILRDKLLTVTQLLIASQTVAVVLLILFTLLLTTFGVPLRKNENIFWFALAGTVVLNIWIQYAGSKAAELGEASLVAPVSSLTPGLVTIPALLLGEWPSHQGWLGVAMIMVGNFIHARGEAPWRDWWRIFALLRLPRNYDFLSAQDRERTWNNVRALRWAYGGAIGGACGLVFDGLMARSGDLMIGITLKWVLLTLCFVAMNPFMRREKKLENGEVASSKLGRMAIIVILLCGLSITLGDGLAVAAFRLAPIAYVGSLKRLSIIFGVLLSWVFLREEKAKVRLIPAALVTVGAILIALDGTAARLISHVEMFFR